jgi:transglutaminase-like putative cysteine protease
MLLHVTHETHYQYAPEVEAAQHMAYLRPLTYAGQKLLSYELNVQPLPSHCREQIDVFGNIRSFFSIDSAHAQLRVQSRASVMTQTLPSPLSALNWESVATSMAYRGGQACDAASEFVFASAYAIPDFAFAQYAHASFLPQASLLDGAIDLMQRIHRDFTYDSQSTEINTPATTAFAQRKGVCQDFAHIFIACLRSLGLPARYVSGYLLNEPPPGMPLLIGADASHAWASVYIPDLAPGQRWVDLDPTNNRWGLGSPGEDYVTLAIGRDFGDVSPLRGVIQGGASHVLTVGVTVRAENAA